MGLNCSESQKCSNVVEILGFFWYPYQAIKWKPKTLNLFHYFLQDAEDRRKSLEAAALEKLAEKIRKGEIVRAKKATMAENEQAA